MQRGLLGGVAVVSLVAVLARLISRTTNTMPYDEYVEIETLERPRVKYFQSHFLGKQMPVKISGAIDDWPAIKANRWSLDYFEKQYGQEVVGIEKFEPGERGQGKNSPQDYVKFLQFQDMKVADLIRVLKTKPDHMYYMAQHPFRKCFNRLREDIGDNPYLKGCIQYVPGAHMDTYLWIGPKGTLTPIHQDPMPNFLIQVVGRKLVHLFPAAQAEKNLYIGQFERPSFSPVDVEDPDLNTYPDYRDCTHYRTILHPGEMLHIPRNWGHAVRSLDISISLSSFFITYGLLFKLLPEYVILVMDRVRQSFLREQINERARVNPPPRSTDKGGQTSPQTVMLAANENPEPVAEEILDGIRVGAGLVNRYTFETEARVLKKLASYYHCPEKNMVLVRGIDEAFDRLSHEFPAMRFATAWPGFDGYVNRIRVHGYRHLQIRLTDDFALDPTDLEKLSTSDFVFLADPSNPTGRLLSGDEHRSIRERAGKVFIDETYADYAGGDGGCPAFGGNVFVFRSFSKSFGLAGARVGVVFGDEDVISRVRSKQWYCNIGVLDLCALEAAIENDFLRKRHIEKTVAERERMNKSVESLRFRVYPSAGNFILMRDDKKKSIETFLRDRSIVVLNTARFGLLDHVRITVGLPAENDRVLEALTEYAAARRDAHAG